MRNGESVERPAFSRRDVAARSKATRRFRRRRVPEPPRLAALEMTVLVPPHCVNALDASMGPPFSALKAGLEFNCASRIGSNVSELSLSCGRRYHPA